VSIAQAVVLRTAQGLCRPWPIVIPTIGQKKRVPPRQKRVPLGLKSKLPASST